jgi:hypothetical protein
MKRKYKPLGKELDWDIIMKNEDHRYEHMEFSSVQEFIDWHRADMKRRYGSDYFEKVRERNKRAAKIDKVIQIIVCSLYGAFGLFMIIALIKVLLYGFG